MIILSVVDSMVPPPTSDLTKVKNNGLSFINEQLSAGTVCGSLRGTEPLRKGFGYF